MPAKTVKRESPYLRVGTTIYKRVRQPLSSGRSVETLIPWIALILLAYIGGKMLMEGIKGEETEEAAALSAGALFVQGVATSIDALAIGVTFAFLETAILPAIGIIGCTTCCISVAGVAVGCWFGARYKQRAEITGGVILVLLGCKILLEHLGLLSF